VIRFDNPKGGVLKSAEIFDLLAFRENGMAVSGKGQTHLIIVVGAGPAGMSVANLLSKAGHEVVILNRDIKFGGLAEYGIFPNKLKLRGGLRKAYWEVLERPNVHYFGNVSVGRGKSLTVDELRNLGASALIFATGAQGTKTIGVEGDSATGVYHAKDVVYHFNRLPGFAEKPFEMGQRVAVIGVGDVMVDVAHWLTRYKQVEEVTAIARRGPAERKYNPKEIRAICSNIDREALSREFDRVRARLEAVGQNPDELLKGVCDEFTKCEPLNSRTRMGFRFLASPRRVLTDAQNRVRGLEIEETRLEPKGQDFAAVGLKQYYEFSCDSVVFAVGDRVDEAVGLPYKNGVFVTNPSPTTNDPDDSLFQAYDEASGKVVEGVFLAGWARKASEGLVGVAKRDGEWCAEVVTRYLEGRAPRDRAAIAGVMDQLRRLFEERRVQAINVESLRALEEAEKSQGAAGDCIGEFKFASNQDMLAQIQRRREGSRAPAAR
jgi:ferredoxin--NADP+ reductase